MSYEIECAGIGKPKESDKSLELEKLRFKYEKSLWLHSNGSPEWDENDYDMRFEEAWQEHIKGVVK